MDTFRADIEDARHRKREAREARRTARRESPHARFRFWALLILGSLALAGVIAFVAGRTYLYRDMPALPDKAAMWELNLEPTVTLLDRDGTVLGQRGPLIGRPRTLGELPPHLPAAVLAIEDERFYEHEGVDQRAILRAAWENFREGDRGQGGSTLTQQLVKNISLTPSKTYRRKFQEAVLAARMEEVLTKPEILELYINRVPMGARVFGVEAASREYFGKPATEVTLAEAALLAALPKAPSRLDPRGEGGVEAAWQRAGLVLDRMVANGLVTPVEAADARADRPAIVEAAEPPVPPAVLGYAFDMAQEEAIRLARGEREDLVVTVTLRPADMVAAHDALVAQLEKNGSRKKVTEGALVSLDNASGAVLAVVGGRDYGATKFNRAVQAERQPGSTFKAFVYAAALEDGFTPGTVRIDQPLTIEKWTPENYTDRYRGPMTLREALKLSINTVAAQVGAEVGPTRVAALAERFGITATELRPHYSLALGSSEVTLMDLTAAFSVFANDGLRRPPVMVLRVEDTTGRTLWQYRERAPERVYNRGYAQQMTGMMHDVLESGTGYAARFGGRDLAGKTGTSQDYRDAWFVGYSRDITAGVWMGNDDNTPMREVTGGQLPVDVWKAYMREAHDGLPPRPLSKPDPALDPFRESVVSFYESLSAELESERNVAAGIEGE